MALSKAGGLQARGFTLIELLVVCGILAALSYLAWGAYAGVQERAEDELARAQMLRLADALKRFRADTGHYPWQGPFVLSSAGTTVDAGNNCTPPLGGVTGVLRAWAAPADDAAKDAWFASPANLALLFTAPALCTNHPLAFLAAWNADTRRGWHGPYLDTAARQWVDHGADFNTADGSGSPVAGDKLADIPAFGAGPNQRAAGPQYAACADQASTAAGNTCMLGWRTLPRATAGYDAERHELATHPRPFALFGLAANDFPRIVYWGRDGRYGGRNAADPCLANAADPDGADDQVLCLGN